LVSDVFLDRLFVDSADGFCEIAWGPELSSPEVFLFEFRMPLEEFSRADALEYADAIGDRDIGRDGNEHVHMIRRYFDLQNFQIVVVGCFDEDLFEDCGVGFCERFAPVFGSPDDVVFQPGDVMLSPVQVHALDSLAPSGRCAIHRGGKPPRFPLRC
jgi:hypothetical protein